MLPAVCLVLENTRQARDKAANNNDNTNNNTPASALILRIDQTNAFIGKALVQLAKLYVDPFRVQVAALPGSSTSDLQLCMRDAILAEKANGLAVHAGGGGAMSLKIDSSKFKK